MQLRHITITLTLDALNWWNVVNLLNNLNYLYFHQTNNYTNLKRVAGGNLSNECQGPKLPLCRISLKNHSYTSITVAIKVCCNRSTKDQYIRQKQKCWKSLFLFQAPRRQSNIYCHFPADWLFHKYDASSEPQAVLMTPSKTVFADLHVVNV